MVDKNEQIKYWIKGAEDDLVTSELLIRENRVLHGLFFCHLVIEKVIKAHIVKISGEVAPRSHNLFYLSEKAGLVFDNNTEIYFWEF